MKKVFQFTVVMFFVFFVAIGCDNKKFETKDDEGELGDAEVTDDPDVKDKDENGEFITAGGTDSNRDKGEGDYGDSGNTGSEEDENAAGDDSAEREIVESDIYKVEGKTIWVVNRYKGLIAIDMTDPKALKVVGKAPFKGIPGEMYLQEGRAYVLVTGLDGSDSSDVADDDGYWGGRSMSRVIVINTEKPSDPKVIGSYEMDGTIVDSRQVGDVIYVAATQYRYYWYWCDSRDEYGKDQITLISINVADPKNIKKVDEIDLPGTAYTIYVSNKSIYVAEANYDYWNDDYNEKYPVTLFDISDPDGKIVKKGKFETEGFMSDRWKMYEKGDVFFAVSTSDRWGNGKSMIESFDISDPENIEQIDKLVFMTGQELYGTKFEGDRVYAVTYYRQDPLHVIDISDPENLVELGELKVPGWSTHLEIRGDKILAVGIDDQDGWKTKVSMYDVSDPSKPDEMSIISIGSNYSWSEANYDWKAFKIYDDLGLILLPVNEYEENTWKYLYKLYLIDFDLKKGLKQRGSVVSDSPVMRGVALEDDKIVSIGDRHVMIIDAADRDKPEILSTAVMAYYVSDLQLCGNELCGLDNNYYGQPSTLVTYEAGNDTNPVKWRSSPVSKQGYGYSNLVKSGDMGYMFNNMSWYYNGAEDGETPEAESDLSDDENDSNSQYVKIFKFEKGKNPSELGLIKILPPEEENTDKYYYSYNNVAVSTNNVLAFVSQDWDYFYPESDCYNSDEDCVEKGDGYSIYKSKMYVYNTTDPTVKEVKPVVISNDARALDYDTKIIAKGTTFWYTECVRKGVDEKDRELLYCYAVPVDVKNPEKPVKGKKVNIPGKIIGMSDDGNYLYTYHYMWNDNISKEDDYFYNSTYYQTLYILKFNEDKSKVSVVKKISVSNSYEETSEMYRSTWSDFIIKDKKIFVSTNESTYHYNQEECNYWYYSNRESELNVQIFRAEDGKRIFSKSYKNGSRYSSVEGGGFLVSIEDNQNYYYSYVNSDNMVYISTEGLEREVKLSEKTYGYYSYSLSSAKIGDNLFVARDWNGIDQVSVK